jgi:uracil-DNA glycosylase
MDDIRRDLHAYLRQQKELGMPDYVLSAPLNLTSVAGPQHKSASPIAYVKEIFSPDIVPPAPVARQKKGPSAAVALLPATHLHGTAPLAVKRSAASDPQGADPVRDALVKLYNENKNCLACGLGKLRHNFVFGSGNAHASLMLIGEAPGADEDEQGLPFVGKAGELLTKMLAAINIDRKKHVFIANVLKCRPPENRNPEQAEILACKHILLSQIDIINPKVILLLGRIAAHTLLDTNASIAALRTQTHTVAGIPAFVTYHPAALLRNEDNKKPAWEDMQKLQRVLIGAPEVEPKDVPKNHDQNDTTKGPGDHADTAI